MKLGGGGDRKGGGRSERIISQKSLKEFSRALGGSPRSLLSLQFKALCVGLPAVFTKLSVPSGLGLIPDFILGVV